MSDGQVLVKEKSGPVDSPVVVENHGLLKGGNGKGWFVHVTADTI